MYSPWVIYYKELEQLFGKDKDIKIEYINDIPCVKLYVDSEEKADALAKLLPSQKVFGSVTLHIDIIPANNKEDRLELMKKAFKGNPVVSIIKEDEEFGNKLRFVVFVKEVVQYKNDDISDANSVCSTLYQEIAKEILEEKEGVYFSTSLK